MARIEKGVPQEKEATEIEDVEKEAFAPQESEAVLSLTEKYAETAKLDKDTKNNISGILRADAEGNYRDFALKWYEENTQRMQEAGIVIPEQASDEWKINTVLSQREKGGMGASYEIGSDRYKEFGAEADKIKILQGAIRRERLAPESPFLLLHYLQERLDKEQGDIIDLQAKERMGDKSAGAVVAGKIELVKKIKDARVALAVKIGGGGIIKKPEDIANDTEMKRMWLSIEEKDIQEDVEGKDKDALIDKEWRAYLAMPEKQREKYIKKLGFPVGTKLAITREEFDATEDGRQLTGKDADDEFLAQNREMFINTVSGNVRKNGVSEAGFYGMLSQGYKPYEPFKTEGLFRKTYVFERNGVTTRIASGELKGFIGGIGDNYASGLVEKARQEAELRWKKHTEEVAFGDTESAIIKLSISPENAIGGVEAVYNLARERIVTEYVRARAEKNPQTKAKLSETEKKVFKKGSVRDLNEVITATLFDNDFPRYLEGDVNQSRKNMGEILNNLGIDVPAEALRSISKSEFVEAVSNQKKGGIFKLFLKLIGMEPRPKKKPKAKQQP